jgi:hypothetical protein
MFFLEKKNQKTSPGLCSARGDAMRVAQTDQVFLLLFLRKKKSFLA